MTATKKRYGPSRRAMVVQRRNTFSFELKAWRKEHGITQKELCATVGIGTNRLSLIETGKASPDAIVAKLAELGFSMAQEIVRRAAQPQAPEPEPAAATISNDDVPLGEVIRCQPR